MRCDNCNRPLMSRSEERTRVCATCQKDLAPEFQGMLAPPTPEENARNAEYAMKRMLHHGIIDEDDIDRLLNGQIDDRSP